MGFVLFPNFQYPSPEAGVFRVPGSHFVGHRIFSARIRTLLAKEVS